MFLRLNGRSVNAQAVREATDKYVSEMSLVEIRDTCLMFDQPVVIRRILPRDFRQITLPAILHFSGASSDDIGHYWVVTNRTDDDRLDCIDGTSANSFVASIEKLEHHERWTGYIILVAPERDISVFAYVITGGCLLTLLWTYLRKTCEYRTSFRH
jgi:hypothetical protein